MTNATKTIVVNRLTFDKGDCRVVTVRELAHIIDEPIPFQGTASDKEVNYASHSFFTDPYGDVVCVRCDTRPHWTHAFYPCGATAPRQARVVFHDGTSETHILPEENPWGFIDQLEKEYLT